MLRHFKSFPGVVVDDTPYSSQGFAIASDWIRWVEGRAEKMGGYVDACPNFRVPGKTRSQLQWTTIRGAALCALGSSAGLFVVVEDRVHHITPLLPQLSGVLVGDFVTAENHDLIPGQRVHVRGAGLGGAIAVGANPFQIATGLSQVLVSAPAHGLADNTLVTIAGASAVAGEDANGFRTVLAPSADTLVLHLDDLASTSGSFGGAPTIHAWRSAKVLAVTPEGFRIDVAGGNGAVAVVPELRPGREDGVLPGGYGIGGYGVGPYGGTPSAATRANYLPRVWSLDKFGGDTLVAAPVGSSLYRWDVNPSKRAVLVPNAPAHIDWLCVTPERVCMAFGVTHFDGTYDPLAVRWSDVQDLDSWIPTTTNNAGDDRYGRGSYIVGAYATANGIVVWTDTAVYSGVATGDVASFYKFDLIADNCGLISPVAAIVKPDGEAWWVGPGAVVFSMAGGSPVVVECPVTSWLDIDPVQAYKVFMVQDSRFSGISICCPGRYVRLDQREAAQNTRLGWSVGTHRMTTWGDLSVMRYALSVREDGKVCSMETGRSADGEPLPAFVRFAPTELEAEGGNGEFTVNVNRVHLDAIVEGTIRVSLVHKRWPENPDIVKGPWRLSPGKLRFDPRVQGRQFSLEVGSDGADDHWRLGQPRVDTSQGPRR